jgi:hypothetical protein
MTDAECERKIALLRASWSTFDDLAARVSPELRKGPRGGGWERDRIIRHVNGAEIDEFAPKVGAKVPLDTRNDAEALRTYRDAFVRGDPRTPRSRRGGAIVGAAIPDPTLCLAHA